MAFREVDVVEIREVLRGWLDGGGLRTIAERAGVDRKTARRYVQAAQAAGLVRNDGPEALTDELIGAVVEQVRPARPNGHGAVWDALTARRAEITGWVKDGRTIVKIEDLLTRSVSRREARSAANRAAYAGLLPLMRLDTWTEPDNLIYDRQLLGDLTTLRFVEAGHNLLVLGAAVIAGWDRIRRRSCWSRRCCDSVKPCETSGCSSWGYLSSDSILDGV